MKSNNQSHQKKISINIFSSVALNLL